MKKNSFWRSFLNGMGSILEFIPSHPSTKGILPPININDIRSDGFQKDKDAFKKDAEAIKSDWSKIIKY